jgi:hypothetical protein
MGYDGSARIGPFKYFYLLVHYRFERLIHTDVDGTAGKGIRYLFSFFGVALNQANTQNE